MAWRGRVTRPPPAGWLAAIGYLTASSVGAGAVGVAYCLVLAVRGEPLFALAAVPVALVTWGFAWVNRGAVAWWVRRQPPEPPPGR